MFLYLPVKLQLYQEDLGNYTYYGIVAWKLPTMYRTLCILFSGKTPVDGMQSGSPGDVP